MEHLLITARNAVDDSEAIIDYSTVKHELQQLLYTGSRVELENYVDQWLRGIQSKHKKEGHDMICFGIMLCLQNIINDNKGLSLSMRNGQWLQWRELLGLETSDAGRAWIKEKLVNAQLILQEQSEQPSQLIRRIKKYIEQHYAHQLTLEDISDQFYYSPNYLNGVFKQQTGITISYFILTCRMEQAKLMLSEGYNKLYEIANRIGYSHTTYFSRLFKRYTGVSPKDYRASLIQA